jgi:hypothetical protein
MGKIFSKNQIKNSRKIELSKILNKYILYSGVIPHDWVVKLRLRNISI